MDQHPDRATSPRLVIPPRPTPPPNPRPFPTPGPGDYARRHPTPPKLSPDRDPDATYLLDTGLGSAFAHVHRLQLLADHYAGQLRYVDDVALEWRVHAGLHIEPLWPGHSADDKLRHDQRTHLKAAGHRLGQQAQALFGPPLETSEADLDAIDDLVRELNALHPPRPDSGGDRGECASVHAGVGLRATGAAVVVLCANDDRARRLASTRGLAHRNMHTVLREMVREDRLSDTDAFSIYQQMALVTELPAHARPAAAADFT